MLEGINPSYPRILVEFSTHTAQESEAATHIENLQLVISSERKRSKGVNEHGLYYLTCLLRGCRCRMVISPKVWFLSFFSHPRMSARNHLLMDRLQIHISAALTMTA